MPRATRSHPSSGSSPPAGAGRGAFQPRPGQGQRPDGVREPGDRGPEGRRDARPDHEGVAVRQGERAGPPALSDGCRADRMTAPRRSRGSARRRGRCSASLLGGARAPAAGPDRARRCDRPSIALASTIVFFGFVGVGGRQLAGTGRTSSDRSSTASSSVRPCPSGRRVLGQHPAVPRRRGPHPGARPGHRGPAQPARARCFFPLRLMATVYADVFRAVPGSSIIYILGFGIPGARHRRRAERPVLLRGRRPDPRLLGLRVRGVPGGHRVRPSEPGRGGPLARPQPVPGPPLRGHAAGRPARDPAPAQRLHRAPEGHGPRLVHRRGRDLPRVADHRGGAVQLHALPRYGARLPRDHDPAGALHRLARRARPARAGVGHPVAARRA